MRLPFLGALVVGVTFATFATLAGHAMLPVVFAQPITGTRLDFWARLLTISAVMTILFWQPWKMRD